MSRMLRLLTWTAAATRFVRLDGAGMTLDRRRGLPVTAFVTVPSHPCSHEFVQASARRRGRVPIVRGGALTCRRGFTLSVAWLIRGDPAP
jgi:hypothetical protein